MEPNLEVITFLAPLGCLEAKAMASVAMDWNDIHTANLEQRHYAQSHKTKKVKGHQMEW